MSTTPRPETDHEPNGEEGDYIEDDPKAWLEWVAVMRLYGPQFAGLSVHLGGDDAAAEVLAGAALSRLAGVHGLYLTRTAPMGEETLLDDHWNPTIRPAAEPELVPGVPQREPVERKPSGQGAVSAAGLATLSRLAYEALPGGVREQMALAKALTPETVLGLLAALRAQGDSATSEGADDAAVAERLLEAGMRMYAGPGGRGWAYPTAADVATFRRALLADVPDADEGVKPRKGAGDGKGMIA